MISPFVFGAAAGATPTFVAAGTVSGASTATGVAQSVSYPAGLLANDILIIQISYNDPNLTTDPTISWSIPTGFTAMGSAVTVLGMTGVMFWRRATGSETGTVSSTRTGGFSAGDRYNIAQMTAWRGCKTSGDPFEALASNTKTDATMVGSSVTTTGANRRVVALHNQQAFDRTLEGPLTSTPATGWTEDSEQSNGATAGYGTVVASSIEKAAAGSQAAESRTLSAARRTITFSFALIPA